jgi:hypothetical protein
LLPREKIDEAASRVIEHKIEVLFPYRSLSVQLVKDPSASQERLSADVGVEE